MVESEKLVLVVVGASAGGIESISQLLSALSAAFPLPIIVAQHLDPTHVSHLVEVLGRRSALPVRALEAATALEGGVVYVVPPGNDAKHASGSSHIDVGLRPVADGAAHVDLVVEDYGAGIPAVDLPHIFGSFYQVDHADRRSRGGMGLGLFIAKEIVDAHGGTISAESELGKGTRVTVRLPLQRPPKPGPDEAPRDSEGKAQTK